MIKKNLKNSIFSWKYLITVIIIAVAIVGDMVIMYGQSNIKDRFSWFDIEYVLSKYRDPYMLTHDAGGCIMGFYVFAFIAAFTVLKLCGDECEKSYMNISIPRVGFFKYIVSRYVSVYIAGAVSIVLAYILSFFIAHFAFGMPLDFSNSLEIMHNNGLSVSRIYSLMNDGKGIVVLLIVFLRKSMYIGLWSVVTLAISVYLKDRSLALFVSAAVIIVYDCITQLSPKVVTKCLSANSMFMGDGVESLPYEGVPLHMAVMGFLSLAVFFVYAYGVHRRMRNG